MELGDGVLGVFEVVGGVPRLVGVWISDPLDSILEFVADTSGVENLFEFPLLFIVDDNWRGRRLLVSGDRIVGCLCRFEYRDVEDRMEFDRGR